jgi:S1-C subfamily serine protease
MRDSDIKPDTAGETRSDPIINPASNAPAVRGRCRVGSRFLCALVALSPAILSPQYTQAGAPPQPIADVVAKVKAAVVEVVVVRPKDDEENTGQRVVQGAAAPVRRTMAIGSRFLIDRSGYIATNKHVIENAVAVFAATPDGIRYGARIIGMAGKAYGVAENRCGQRPSRPTIWG